MNTTRAVEARIAWLLSRASDAEARGERHVARNLRALARDLEPAR
jgi:hypothetical protein